MARRKITVIGAGNVGASVAQQVLAQHLGDVVLVDVQEDLAQGKALDLSQAGAILGYTGSCVGTGKYEETIDSDVIVVTSGSPRKPGMSRDDLLKINCEIVHTVVGHAAAASPDAVLVVVTNPLDAMTYAALKASGFPARRVTGMAGILDTARYRFFLSLALGVSPENVEAMVLGGHGDEMVPCVPLTRVGGSPVADWLPAEELERLVARTRAGGAEIVQLLKSGSAYYAPAAAAVRMVGAILRDEQALLPCAAWLEGEYGLRDVMVGVPVVLGRAGILRIPELKLAAEDLAALRRSAEAVRELMRQVDEWCLGNLPK
ncbi:MAG: malate dehydrogenase [candidate division FCPU426 bacterium]